MAVDLDDVLLERKAGGASRSTHDRAQLRYVEQANAMAIVADHAGIRVVVAEQIGIEGFDALNAALLNQTSKRSINLVRDERRAGP